MIAMVVEGILMKPVASTIIPLGAQVYHAFRSINQVLLISNETPVDQLESWLWMEQISGYAEIYPPDDIMQTRDDYRLWQVNQARKKGYNIELVIEPNPDNCSLLLANGYSVLNFLHAQYALPAWRPDFQHKITPWNELSDQVARLAAMRAADKRTQGES